MLAVPLTHIYKRAFRESRVPSMWKQATVVPVPKKAVPESPGDLRPVSLTPTFSKVMEQFIVPLIVADIREQLDKRQFGNINGASANHYLIRFLHSLRLELDNPGKLFSAVMHDFRKGFDLIDHTLLINKMIAMGLRLA